MQRSEFMLRGLYFAHTAAAARLVTIHVRKCNIHFVGAGGGGSESVMQIPLNATKAINFPRFLHLKNKLLIFALFVLTQHERE
jgi:hypothetical protein